MNQSTCLQTPTLFFWSTLGNNLPNNTLRFIGTTNNYDFRIRTNNIERAIVKADGKVGIGAFGSSSPSSLFEVKGAGTSSTTSSLNVTNSSSNSLFHVRDDGKVGVGTTSPSE